MTTEDAQAAEKVALTDVKPCIASESHGPHLWNGYPPDVWRCPGRSRLTEADEALLAEAFGGATPSSLLATRVERIVADRVADAAERERAAREHAEDWCTIAVEDRKAAERALATLREDVRRLITGTFQPDFAGWDWPNDRAVQLFVRDLYALLEAQS